MRFCEDLKTGADLLKTVKLTGEHFMDGTKRADIKRGLRVSIVLKKDQQTEKLTEGIAKEIHLHIRMESKCAWKAEK